MKGTLQEVKAYFGSPNQGLLQGIRRGSMSVLEGRKCLGLRSLIRCPEVPGLGQLSLGFKGYKRALWSVLDRVDW